MQSHDQAPEIQDNVYTRQQLTLAPFTSHFSQEDFLAKLTHTPNSQRSNFLKFLLASNLSTAWLEQLGSKTFSALCTEQELQAIRNHAIRVNALYLKQNFAIQEFTEVLQRASIPYAIFKGAHTRELVYSNPATRPSCDIDILIHENNIEEVINLFKKLGYTLYAPKINLSHEFSLNRANVSVDLHWHILRPGRITRQLTDQLLANRIQHGNYWCCDDTANLFILLIHPVFSDYSQITRNGLIRMLDLLNWFTTQQIDHPGLQLLLDQTGLRTTAWITLTYLHFFTGDAKIQKLANDLSPSPIKKAYLNLWLQNDLAARLIHYPMAVKLFFTLFAHDSLGHSCSFIKTFLSRSSYSQKDIDLPLLD